MPSAVIPENPALLLTAVARGETPFNDYIKPALDSFRMNPVDTAVSHSSKGCYFAVVDIESAWCWVPVFPPHRQLQGFLWMFGEISGRMKPAYKVCAPGWIMRSRFSGSTVKPRRRKMRISWSDF